MEIKINDEFWIIKDPEDNYYISSIDSTEKKMLGKVLLSSTKRKWL